MVLSFDAKSHAEDDADKQLTALLELFMKELVEITPGEGEFPKSFEMGSNDKEAEKPVHEVTLTQSFALAKYEVPQNLYEAVMGDNPSKWKGKRNSVEMMPFTDAIRFCTKMTFLLRKRQLIADDDVIRLPTEAEWEYCCRAGTKTAYSFGDEAQGPDDDDQKNQASVLNKFGWHTGNAAGNDPPVGAKQPNPWGLYDMHGYLWEFTLDDWSSDYEGAPTDGSARLLERKESDPPAKIALRSGSWKNRYPDLRSSARIGFPRDQADDAVGFRCVKSKK